MKNLVLLVKPAAGLCNMNCRYCFYRSASGSRENRIMQKETVDKLISRVAEYEPSSLCVMFQGGEPTLAGLDFFEYFVSETKKNISVPVSYSLQTNGLLVDDAFAKFFKKNNKVCLDNSKKKKNNNKQYLIGKGAVVK